VGDWRRYPFELVPGDPQFRFPGAEAAHADCESDTWFLAGQLTGDTGRRFAFLTIFNKNRPGQTVVADFYTFALFDLDNGSYATYTDYDMPPGNMQPDAIPKMSMADDHLDIAYDSSAGRVTWTACRDGQQLEPYTYDLVLAGTDHAGEPMELRLHVTPTRPPVPVGASAYNGKFTCFGQDNTFSYFQTGMKMAGILTWGSASESVTGGAGHVDRQWFPKYAGGGGTDGDPRARSHEWRTINLDNGVDLSIWRQFDRTSGNALQPFSGATTSSADAEPECVEDIEVVIDSYVRWPETVRPLVPPLAAPRYMPDRHQLSSRTLHLELTGEPLVAAPAHALPIEYMEGPYSYRGTFRGKSVTGFAFYERSLALYRDWELVDVLAASDASMAAEVRRLMDSGRKGDAIEHLEKVDTSDPELGQIVADLVAALSQ
jgi:predicted secreted hydrolase